MRQKGFAPLVIILVVAILAVIGYFAYSAFKGNPDLTTIFSTQTQVASPTVGSTAIPTPVSKTIKPLPTSKPTVIPTPTVVVNNKFTCGEYDQVTRPPIPAKGDAPLYEVLYPAGGIANGYSFFGWQLDYNGDGIWDTDKIKVDSNNPKSSRFPYTYDKGGSYTPKFRVVATNGEVGPTCTYPFDITVGSSPSYQNGVIAVDKLNFEVTVSRSKQNFEFPWFEKDYTNGGGTIYIPGFNVSSKENFTFVGFKNPWDALIGVFSTGANIDAGTSADFPLFINKSKPNGTYEGNQIITYTTGPNGTVINNGPTVKYKITLTD